jgi:antidote-toxin recognition MazE-like antitoxin
MPISGMSQTMTIQVRGRGTLTLPASLREKYRLGEGDPLTVVDLDGAVLLSPRLLVAPRLAADVLIAGLLSRTGASHVILVLGEVAARGGSPKELGCEASRGRPALRGIPSRPKEPSNLRHGDCRRRGSPRHAQRPALSSW